MKIMKTRKTEKRSVRDCAARTTLYWRWLNILAEVWS